MLNEMWANAALIILIADQLKISKGKVEIIAGHTSRNKTVKINQEIDLEEIKTMIP